MDFLKEIPIYSMDDLSICQENSSNGIQPEMDIMFSKPTFAEENLESSNPYLPVQSPVSLLCTWEQQESDNLPLQDKVKRVPVNKTIKKIDTNNKKMIKQMRNRISAQQSRDRKKQELEYYKNESERLRQENMDLKSQLESAKSQLEALNQIMDKSKVVKKKTNKKKLFSSRSKLIFTMILLFSCCMAHCMNPLMKSFNERSEERRVGKECTSWCRSRW